MIRDGFINIYGCMTEDYVEGDPRPCPKCGMSDIKVIRAMEYEPQGFRLGCMHCGYEVPEEDMVFAQKSEKGMKEAIEVWDRLAIYASLEEEAEKAEEELARIEANKAYAEEVLGGPLSIPK